MITFSCFQCGTKFKVHPQFAGRSTKCPTCKHALVVPPADSTEDGLKDLDGPPSSLHQLGADANISLEKKPTRVDHAPTQAALAELLARGKAEGQRYVIEGEIARGGMGSVLRAVDCDIRREVAVKYLLDQRDARKKLRFIEEAQITGQLEHPNIVPIHELAVDASKRLFFSMKMVKGRSLAQVFEELRQHSKGAEQEFSQGRLLTVFVNVCHALGYAHARGVVHRDLKPANIMMGDFGEVYVMDWGLAKVVHKGSSGVSTAQNGKVHSVSAIGFGNLGIAAQPTTKVLTSREEHADLSQDGAILGTPAYMPPEQAAGKTEAIDQRTDVYALGAILYEMLCLSPPFDNEGGYVAVLMRVMQGEIVPPEQRLPHRVRPGKISRELSAIAMKALAKNPADRYPTVADMQLDLERFIEGRAVSAKHDTTWEMFRKLVKRNKGASVASVIGLLVLTLVLWFSFRLNNKARVDAETAYRNYREEQKAKAIQARLSVPAFLKAAHFSVREKQFEDALSQLNVVLEYEPEHVKARLLKGQLLIVLKRFPEAGVELAKYLDENSGDVPARKLAELCRTAKAQDVRSSAAFAQVLLQQGAGVLAESMANSREDLLRLYRKRIEAAWPGLGNALTMDQLGNCEFSIGPFPRITNLNPLEGIPLTKLTVRNGLIPDLAPLRNMPLTYLDLAGCAGIRDLTPLQGMPITILNLQDSSQVRDLTPLRGMPLTHVFLRNMSQVQDISVLAGRKLTMLDLSGCGAIRDLTPLAGMPLTRLGIGPCASLRDLEILRRMPLGYLEIGNCPMLQDLSALRGMKLESLKIIACHQISDLRPLKDMPLTYLSLTTCGRVEDLTPLKGLRLTNLELDRTSIRDLAPLQGMPLKRLSIQYCQRLDDLSPLEGIPVEEIYLTPHKGFKGMEVLPRLARLKKIIIWPDKQYSGQEFVKRYAAGEWNK